MKTPLHYLTGHLVGRRAALTVLGLVLFFSLQATAQQVHIQMNLPPPGTLNPEDLTEVISFNNTTANTLHVRMMATVEEEEKGMVFSGMSSVFSLPPGFSVPDYTAYEPVEVEYADPVVEDYVIQTNNMPGGEYVVCVTLFDAEMGDELGYHCVPHSVFHPSAPMLVYPADGGLVHEPAPVFVWLPPAPMPPVELFYSVRMVEVLEGQLPYEAMQSNPAWFEDHQAMTGTYPYPADAEPMEQGKMYAWQVQALMGDGFPVGENMGYSEIQTFLHDPGHLDDGMLAWISPADGEEVNQPHLLFRWSDPAFADGLPPTGHYYALYIWKQYADDPADEPGEVFEAFTGMSDPMLIYPSYARPLTPGEYAAQVLRMHAADHFVPGDVSIVHPGEYDQVVTVEPGLPGEVMLPGDILVVASSPLIHFSFTEATLEACCDTIAVMNKIWDDIDAIKEDLCVDKKSLMDRLLAALDAYVDKQWEADALKGRLDAASEFKDYLDAFKDQAMDGLQGEIDRLSDLKDNCNTNWETDFYNRYVANPDVCCTHEGKMRKYNRAVGAVQRRFDRHINNQINNLQSRKDQIASRYDNLSGQLDDYIADTQDAHDQAQQEADAKLDLVNDLFNQIKDNLCGIEGQWNDLFAFMLENFCCITKCAEEHVPVPPEFAEMEDCLKDLFNRLLDWKGNIRQPGDQDELKDQANNVFDADKAMDQLQELKDLAAELDAAIDDFNAQSEHMQIVDVACGNLHTYGSGGRSTGRVTAPSDHRGNKYGAPTTPKTFAYKPTGEYAPSRRDRMEAMRERRAFMRNQRDLMSRMNQLAWRLSVGNAEDNFVDPDAIEAHGKAAAVPYHEQTAQALDQMIDAMLDALRDCYDVARHHAQRRRFNDIMTECVEFREALRELDRKYADHAEKTAEDEARLRARLAEIERLIEQLRGRSSASGSTVGDLGRMIEEIKRKISELEGQPVHPDLSGDKSDLLDGLRARLAELERRLREAQDHQADAGRLLGELERLRDQIRDAIDRLGEITPPSPVGSTDEANEASGKVDEERREKEQEQRDIEDLINEAGDLADNLGGASGDASGGASSGLSDGKDMLDDLAEYLDNLRRLTEAKREAERRRRQTDCLRLLEEYRARQDREPGLITRVWEYFWKSKEELDEFPEGIFEDLDELREYLGKLEEWKNRIEQALKLINGINTDDPQARAEAFGEVLKIAEELGGNVPGFGEMLGYYATAYNAAMAAIEQIAENIRRPAKEAIDAHPIRCDPDAWHGQSLDDVLEAEWRRFLQTPGGATVMALSPQQQRTMEAYFKDKAAARVLECCIEELLK